MEKRLKTLFDYQRFKEDPTLAKLIAASESHCSQELGDEEIAAVSAAGDRFAAMTEDTDDDGKPT